MTNRTNKRTTGKKCTRRSRRKVQWWELQPTEHGKKYIAKKVTELLDNFGPSYFDGDEPVKASKVMKRLITLMVNGAPDLEDLMDE